MLGKTKILHVKCFVFHNDELCADTNGEIINDAANMKKIEDARKKDKDAKI